MASYSPPAPATLGSNWACSMYEVGVPDSTAPHSVYAVDPFPLGVAAAAGGIHLQILVIPVTPWAAQATINLVHQLQQQQQQAGPPSATAAACNSNFTVPDGVIMCVRVADATCGAVGADFAPRVIKRLFDVATVSECPLERAEVLVQSAVWGLACVCCVCVWMWV